MDVGANFNCSASYAMTTLSVVEDRICMATNQTTKLSSQEIIDCDINSMGCEGGYANRVLAWGKKKGFITDECMEYSGSKTECEVDHFESNACRVNSEFYRVNDYCLAIQGINIQREIIKNGPVIGQMVPYTDFLAYSSGTYHRTQEAFKFNGYHLVKIVGWSKSDHQQGIEWIIENSWGSDWGENGYAKMLGGRGDTQIDMYTLGVSVTPYTVYDFYSMQNMANSMNFDNDEASDFAGQENLVDSLTSNTDEEES